MTNSLNISRELDLEAFRHPFRYAGDPVDDALLVGGSR